MRRNFKKQICGCYLYNKYHATFKDWHGHISPKNHLLSLDGPVSLN